MSVSFCWKRKKDREREREREIEKERKRYREGKWKRERKREREREREWERERGKERERERDSVCVHVVWSFEPNIIYQGQRLAYTWENLLLAEATSSKRGSKKESLTKLGKKLFEKNLHFIILRKSENICISFGN